MSRCGGIAISTTFSGTGFYIYACVLTLLLLSLAGYACAEINTPDQIKKESAEEWSNRTRFGGDMRLRAAGDGVGRNSGQAAEAASTVTINNSGNSSKRDVAIIGRRPAKDSSDQGVAALVELLKRKNVISSAEANRIMKQAADKTAGAVSESGQVAALAALLERKKIIGAEEAARFTKQFAASGIEQNEKEELKKDIHEQVARQVREEMDNELRKKLPEQVKSQVREELPGGKEQIADLNENVSYLQQKVAEILYGGQAGALAKSQLPGWISRFHLSGDIRLRYEHDRFNKDNVDTFSLSQGRITGTENTFANTDRFKYRVRLGIKADVAENIAGNGKLLAAVRLSTGNTTNPVSTNTLLGDYMNKDNILFDQAYLQFTWKTFAVSPTVYTVWGGRMPNPWFSSDLVWDKDLNFEGLAFNVRQPLGETSDSLTPFLTMGAFPLQSSDPANIHDKQHNKWLYAGQVGIEQKNRTGISAKVGAAYYHYHNITGVLNTDPTDTNGPTDWSLPLFSQGDFSTRGNTYFQIDPTDTTKFGLAPEFRELNLTGTLDMGFWDPIHVVFLADYVRNLGFNTADVAERTGFANPPKYITGYQLGLSVGKPAIETDESWQPGWKLFLNYKYLGADAVVDAFTDSDFHLGGTNAKGWILGAEYGLMKNTWLTARWLTANQISGPPLAIDVFQLDLNAKF